MLLSVANTVITEGLAMGLAVIGVVSGGGGIAATVLAYGRVKSVENHIKTFESTLALQRDENETLKGILADRDQRDLEQRTECDRRVAALEGQLHVLTQQNIQATVTAIVAAVREMLSAGVTPWATPHIHPEGGNR